MALKLMRLERLEDPYHLRLFQREVQALARLTHPGIAAIHDAGRAEDGQHYFVMELVEGLPPNEHVRRAAPTRRERLSLFIKLGEAVQYAHQKGVIHRDLKPSNILINQDGDPKILDFGLARVADPDEALTTLQTEAGKIQGTLPYMSPEQVRGRPDDIDARSDVYSLGVLLYELLTDRRPYDLADVPLPEAARIICEQAPRKLGSASRSLPGDLETIALKALEKDPERRYITAAALADDVTRYLNKHPILARPPSAPYVLRRFVQRHTGLVVGAAAAVVALVVGLTTTGVLFIRETRASKPRR